MKADRSVVVTGTSRGIGRATALRLARRGFQVFGTVRSSDDAVTLEAEGRGGVRALRLDLTDDDSVKAAADRLISSEVDSLSGLVNVAAAAGKAVPLEAVTRDDLSRQLDVAVAGTSVLTAAMIPLLIKGNGRVVNVGAGPISMPLLGTTFVAKKALEAASDVLRVELAAVGVKVIIVEPGMTRWDDVSVQERVYDEALDEGLSSVSVDSRPRYERAVEASKRLNERMLERGAPADRVAATIERALTARRPRTRYYCGVEQKAAALLTRLAPTPLADRIVRRLTNL